MVINFGFACDDDRLLRLSHAHSVVILAELKTLPGASFWAVSNARRACIWHSPNTPRRQSLGLACGKIASMVVHQILKGGCGEPLQRFC